MEDLRNSDWQAIQLLLMLLVIVEEDRTAFITLPSASQRGNTQRQGPVPCHVHTPPAEPRWAEHTQAPELLWSGINPLELIPPQPLCAAATTPSSALLTDSAPKSSFQQAQAEDFALWTLISLWNEAQSKVHLTDYDSRRSTGDKSIRNSCSFGKRKDRLSLLHWHHLASVYWQRKN